MRITDISVTRSAIMGAGSFKMEVTCMTPMGECKATTFFDDLGGFLTAVKETATFFAVRMGRISSRESQRLVTREIAPNPEGSVR